MKNASGITDMLTEDSSVIVPYLSVNDIADAIYKIYADPCFSKQLGASAYELVTTSFSKEKQIQTMTDFILNLKPSL